MATATIHIHPTATHTACIEALQHRTGRVAVISGNTAELVSDPRSSSPKPLKAAWQQPNWEDGDGPSAA